MSELAVIATLLWGAAVALAVIAGEDFLRRGVGAIETDLKTQLRNLRLPTRSAGAWVRGWIVVCVLAGLAVTVLMSSIWAGLMCALAVAAIPWLVIRRIAEKRRAQIEDQLADAMVSFSSAVRSGPDHAPYNAWQKVACTGSSPWPWRKTDKDYESRYRPAGRNV